MGRRPNASLRRKTDKLGPSKRWRRGRRRNSNVGSLLSRGLSVLNQVRISVKDTDVFKLKYNTGATQTYGADNVQAFMDKVRPSACLNAFFRNNLSRYRYVKFNSFTYVISLEAISYSLTAEIESSGRPVQKIKYPSGFVQGFENVPFYLTWDLDNNFTSPPSDDRISADPHGKSVYCSSRRKKAFYYTVPADVRRFVDCAAVPSSDVTKDSGVDEFLSKCTGCSNFRSPKKWFGSIRELFDKTDLKDLVQKDDELPVVFNLYVTCYLNCSFRGYKYV